MRLLCKRSLPACFPVAVSSQRVSYAQSDAYQQQKVLLLKLVNPNCGADSHASVPVWCKNSEVQLCLLCHIRVSTPHGKHLASCKIAMIPTVDEKRQQLTASNSGQALNSSETDRQNAGPTVHFLHTAISTVENFTMCLSH